MGEVAESLFSRASSGRTTSGSARAGVRPSSRSRARIAIGALLSIVAVGAGLLVFSNANRRIAVLQVVHDIPAGTQLTADDVRPVELTADPSLAIVKFDDIASVV